MADPDLTAAVSTFGAAATAKLSSPLVAENEAFYSVQLRLDSQLSTTSFKCGRAPASGNIQE